jgi:sec-independent protein translocase protein TatC
MEFVGFEMINKANPEEKQPFVSHLQELRQRIIICLVTVGIAFLITYYFRDKVNVFLLLPFKNVMPRGSSFIFTGVTEAFITYFKIWMITAAAVSSPVIIYQIWMFVSPGLYEKEKRYVYPLIIWGSLCFGGGVLFCYYIVMPRLYSFFVSFGSDMIIPMPDLKEYVGLTLKLLVVFGFVFEMPLIAFFLARAGIVNHQFLAKKRRYAILAAFILSAIITPPDVISQVLLAVPLWGLYELSIIIARFFGKKKEPVHEGP